MTSARTVELTMHLFTLKISRELLRRVINSCMLKRYLVTDHSALPEILTWVADPDHRSQLIGARVADSLEYHVVLDLTYGHLELVDLLSAEFPTAVAAAEFPRGH
jgi:hypothetical protein